MRNHYKSRIWHIIGTKLAQLFNYQQSALVTPCEQYTIRQAQNESESEIAEFDTSVQQFWE